MRDVTRLLIFVTAWSLAGLTSGCAKEKPLWEAPPVITLSGGVIAPVSQQDKIRMDSMKINILPQARSYVVDAVFHLFNTGEATTEWTGFPRHGKTLDYVSGPSHRVISDFVRFRGWVNGRKELFVEKRLFLRDDGYPFPEPRLTDFRKKPDGWPRRSYSRKTH